MSTACLLTSCGFTLMWGVGKIFRIFADNSPSVNTQDSVNQANMRVEVQKVI